MFKNKNLNVTSVSLLYLSEPEEGEVWKSSISESESEPLSNLAELVLFSFLALLPPND